MKISDLKEGDEFSVRAKFIASSLNNRDTRIIEIGLRTTTLYTDTEIEKIYPRALKVGDKVIIIEGNPGYSYRIVYLEEKYAVVKYLPKDSLHVMSICNLELDKSEDS